MTAPPSPSPIARTALIVHLIALASAVATYFFQELAAGNFQAWCATAGVGATLACVMALWSLVLAARAVLAGEFWVLPYAMVTITFIEISAPFVWYGYGMLINGDYKYDNPWMWEYALPIVVPELLLPLIAVVPAGFCLLRKIDARRASRGKANWTIGRRRKLALLLAIPMSATCSAILLIPSLYLFCAGDQALQFEDTFSTDGVMRRMPEWKRWVAYHTPDFIRDRLHRMLQQDGQLSYSILWNGALSESRMRTVVLEGRNPNLRARAFDGMRSKFHTLDLSLLIGQKSLDLGEDWSACRGAGFDVAENGTPTEFEPFLDPANRAPAMFKVSLFGGLARRGNERAIDALERLIEKPEIVRDPDGDYDTSVYALREITESASGQRMISVAKKYLAAAPEFGRDIAMNIHGSTNVEAWAQVSIMCLRHNNPDVCEAYLQQLQNPWRDRIKYPSQNDRKAVFSVVSEVVSLLDSEIRIRRAAADALADLVGLDRRNIPYSTETVKTPTGETPVPETALERECTKEIRSEARKWLKRLEGQP